MENGGMAMIPILFMFFFGIFGLLAMMFWVWMLYECAAKEPDGQKDKVMWILVIALTGAIGAALYFFIRRPQRLREVGQ